jgi:hypothetical protein
MFCRFNNDLPVRISAFHPEPAKQRSGQARLFAESRGHNSAISQFENLSILCPGSAFGGRRKKRSTGSRQSSLRSDVGTSQTTLSLKLHLFNSL